LQGTTVSATGSNVNATKETDEPNHAGNGGGKSVWWTWTAPDSGIVTITTLGSSFDTLLGVYTGSTVSGLSVVASNDDSPAGGTTSLVTFNAVGGVAYQIAVDGWNGASGSIMLNIQGAISCSYTLSLTNASLDSVSGSGNFNVTTSSGCSWTAIASDTWIHTSSSGSGNGTVSYTIDANPSISLRTGTLTIAGQTFTVTQAGVSCTYSLSISSTSVGSSGGNGSVDVTASGGCTWSASSSASWITITSDSSGTGNGTINYSVLANTDRSSRTETMTIAGQTFTVSQAGVSPVTNLPEFIDNLALVFTTGGDANWFGQTDSYYYGSGSLQSGGVGNNQSSWLETTIQGPVTLSFYWKVSSEARFDYLRFFIDGTQRASISGEVAWQQKTFSIPSGSHTLHWSYTKDGSVSSGADAGWVDRIRGDEANPSLSITVPAVNARVANADITIQGRASDNVGVVAVECRLENANGIGSYQTASGTLNWSNNFSGLTPGTNTVRVRARDTSGNLSSEVTRTFFYVVTSPITLITNSPGSGIIKPGFKGMSLEVGRSYTVTAIPLGNNVFSNWTGTISNTSATLTFLMQSNMVLQANFVTNPFTVVQGIYNGIFSVPTGVTEETAGMVSDFNVTSKGTYSGRLLINGGIYGLAGSFDVWGHANNVIPRPPARGGRLVVDMNVLWQAFPRQIIGTVSGTNGGPWTADPLHLVLNSAATNSADYTMLIPPAANAPLASPGGYGFALITNKASKLFLVGTLADGTAFSQIVSLNEVNGAPLYANLYRNTGLLLGWLNFDSGSFTNGDQIPVGDIAWIKKAVHSRGSYTNGFTNVVSLLGSRWRKPTNGIPALPFTTNNPGILEIQGGNGIDLTNQVAISSNKNSLVKLTTPDYSTNSLSGSIDPKTGLLKVTFGNGHGKATTTGTGAVLQTTTNAAGFFLGTNQSGTILLEGN